MAMTQNQTQQVAAKHIQRVGYRDISVYAMLYFLKLSRKHLIHTTTSSG